jgi:hypothetical protein
MKLIKELLEQEETPSLRDIVIALEDYDGYPSFSSGRGFDSRQLHQMCLRVPGREGLN